MNSDNQISPDSKCSIFHKITYAWIFPLLRIGYKRSLQMEDLYTLDDRYSSMNLTDKFEKNWKIKCENAVNTTPSLLSALFSTFGTRWAWSGLLKLISDILNLITPYLLGLLLNAMENDDSDIPTQYLLKLMDPFTLSITICICIYVALVIASFSLNYYFQIVSQEGLKIRTSLSGSIYLKIYKLSGLSRQKFSSGRAVNLISSDIHKLEIATTFLHYTWSAVFQVIVCIALLYHYLDWACLIGLAILILAIPFQAISMKRIAKYRKSSAKNADHRVKTLKEILQNIRTIKFYAWERAFLDSISEIREKELSGIRKIQFIKATLFAVTSFIPVLSCLVSFITYHFALNRPLEPSMIFPSLGLFSLLRVPLHLLPTVLGWLAEAKVSLSRISEFLLAEELEFNPTIESNFHEAICMKDATFQWETLTDIGTHKDNPRSRIANISMSIPRGSLVGICGPTGSGKSSLLSCLVGEMKYVSGNVTLGHRSIGYCPQQAWMQNATLRENILFGLPFDQERYDDVIHACALEKDIHSLPHGDNTEIGERGINLSGGQKQRIGLARVVYSNTDVVLLDDPLSAVDEQVGRHIFKACILGLLKGKTILLVTHQLYWLRMANWIVVMHNTESGCTIEAQGNDINELSKTISFLSEYDMKAEQDLTLIPSTTEPNKIAKLPSESWMIAEERATGSVQLSVYKAWMNMAGGYVLALFVVISLALVQVIRIYTDYWVSQWGANPNGVSDLTRLVVSVALGCGQGIFNWICSIIFAFGGVKAAREMFIMVMRSVLQSPMIFFDTTPSGRILNRFAKDQYEMDTNLPDSLRMFCSTMAITIATFIMISVITPIYLAILVPLIVFYYYIQKFYRYTSRELKRLDALSRSPLYAQFGETLLGLATIRASHDENRFITRNQQLIDQNNRPCYLQLSAQRWLSLNLELIGGTLVFAAALSCVLFNVPTSLAGLSVGYALSVTGIMTWAVRQAVEVEIQMNSVERLNYYATKLDSEDTLEQIQEIDHWAEKNDLNQEEFIVFEHFSLKYRPNLPPSLIDVSFSIPRGTRVGIVGRTGSGKSTIMAALFRLVDPFEGCIYIQGRDIRTIPLVQLRKKLAIIPQDPALFSGTVRFNLDPENEYDDDYPLWNVLEKSFLKNFVSNLPDRLDSIVEENGENFSVGQRQLLCLARAMLRKAQILLLDEATASVDIPTDTLIQRVLRGKEFQGVTIITIAHRLSTVADHDIIIRMENGKATIENNYKSSAIISNDDSLQ